MLPRSAVAGDGLSIPVIGHAPVRDGQTQTFEELASVAKGKHYLAYLRVDADRVGNAFRELAGDPQRTATLSHRLNNAFSSRVSGLLKNRFPNLYPVYGGGDDLFIVGPWNRILDFAAAWRNEFLGILEGGLTLSAGVTLAKPREHILTKSGEAEAALDHYAKVPRDSIHVLGATIPFSEYEGALECARKLAELHALGKIRSAMLHNLIDVHDRATKEDPRWRALLYYQVERNSEESARAYLKSAFIDPGRCWKHAGFAARYASLSAGGKDN